MQTLLYLVKSAIHLHSVLQKADGQLLFMLNGLAKLKADG